MRFLYYDGIESIVPQKSIKGFKAFALSEEFLRGHFSKQPIVPGVIYIESMAQLLGWLIIYSNNFKLSAIMTLIEGVWMVPNLRPGFLAKIEGEIIDTSKRDTLGRARMISDGKEIAKIDRIIYSHFHDVNEAMLRNWFNYYCGMRSSLE